MPKMVITHPVIDLERWLKGKEERAAVISGYATNVTDHVAADGSNTIAVTADIHDMAGLQAMVASPSREDKALEEKHVVLPPMTVYVEKQSLRRRSSRRGSLIASRRLDRPSVRYWPPRPSGSSAGTWNEETDPCPPSWSTVSSCASPSRS